jgi:branched-chain amino acid aminotransferase
MEERLVYVDGELYKKSEAKVSVFDHGYLYGDGVFEGIRVYNGRIFRCQEHIDRLFCAAKAIMLEIPLSKDEIRDAMSETIRKNGLNDAYVRLVVSRGVGDLGLSPTNCGKPTVVIIADTIQLYSDEMYEKGMNVVTAATRRNNPGALDPQIKSLNYLNNIMAKIEANLKGVPEAIMLNPAGIVCECTGDNVFIIKDGQIVTPPIYLGALDGITRKTVMKIANNLGYEVTEKEFTLFNLYNADECFFTGTAAELIAVTKVDGRVIGSGVRGEVTAKIHEAFQKYAQTPESGYSI